MKKSPKIPKFFSCIFCDYNTSNKKDYSKHLLTSKHKFRTELNKKSPKIDNCFVCKLCNKSYKVRNSLWYHEKKCIFQNNIEEIFEESSEENSEESSEEILEENLGENLGENNLQITKNKTNNNPNNIIVELLKQNQEFKEMIFEQNKKIIEFASKNNVTNNNITNNNFNLQIFLNEKCKDAPNLIDFINSIQLKLSDFENFGTFGYADNISRILLREIKDVDIYKRPIHCSDLKREVIHVKDENAWKKDEDKKHMKKAIKEIAYKNFKTIIPECIKANPESKDITTKKHDQYIKMMNNSMGEITEEGDEKNYNKIIRTVAKEILVDKDK